MIIRVTAVFMLAASLAAGCMIASATASSVTVDKSTVYIQSVSSMNIDYTPSSNYDTADVWIYSDSNWPVKFVGELPGVKAGVKYTTHWDGTNTAGNPVSAGRYYALVDASSSGGSSERSAAGRFNLVTDYSAPTTSASPESGPMWLKSRTVNLEAQDFDWAGVANIRYEISSSSTTTHSYTTYSGSSLAVSLNDGTNYLTYYSTDNAGNAEALHENMVYYCDPSAPTISGAVISPTTTSNGWYTGDVTVRFTASDTLSGVEFKTVDQTLTGSGSGQSVTGTAIDYAGNSATATVSNLNIDKVTPAVTWSAVGASLNNGWYNGPVTIRFSPTVGPSGVSAVTPDVYLASSAGPVTGTLTDGAGRTATVTTGAIKIDGDAPVISKDRTPAANGHGWNNGPVTVSFSASDTNSGLATSSTYSSAVTDGADQTVSWTATDNAGNTATARIDHISVDTVGPSLSAACPSPNAYGWYNESVLVRYSCSDDRSGIDPESVPADHLFSSEGAGQSTTASVSDLAGNTASLITESINIDLTDPTITLTLTPAPAASGWYTSDVTANLTASDTTSGIAAVQYSLDNQSWTDYTGNVTLTNGAYTLYYRATDRAGNTAAYDRAINVDGAAPMVSCSLTGHVADGGWFDSDVTLSLTTADSASGIRQIEYSPDGANWSTYTGPVTIGLDVQKTIYYRATNNAGLVVRKSVFVYFPPKSFTTNLSMTVPTTGPAKPAGQASPTAVPPAGPATEGTATPLAEPASSAATGEPQSGDGTTGLMVLIGAATLGVAGFTVYLLRFRK